jgi:hypothetical protein
LFKNTLSFQRFSSIFIRLAERLRVFFRQLVYTD